MKTQIDLIDCPECAAAIPAELPPVLLQIGAALRIQERIQGMEHPKTTHLVVVNLIYEAATDTLYVGLAKDVRTHREHI